MLSFKFQFILYIAINLLSLYTLNNAISLFFVLRKKCKISIKILVQIVYLIVGTYTYIGENVPVINILVQIFLVMIIMILFYGKTKSKIVMAISWTALIVISELMVGMTYSILFNISITRVVVDDFSKLIGSIMSALVMLIVVRALKIYKRKKENFESFSFFDSLQVGIIPICSIFIMHTLKELSKYIVADVLWFVIFSIVCIVFVNIFYYYLYDRLSEIEKVKYENELLKSQAEYYVEIEKQTNLTFEKIKAIKHDLSHHLLYLKAKIEEHTEESLSEVEKKIDLLLGEVLVDSSKVYTRNQKLNKILNYKLFQVYKENIDIEVKVNIKEHSVIDEECLYVILGNAIDNAVRCLDNMVSTERKVSIRIFDDNNNLYINITNPYIGSLKFKNGLPVTTKQNPSMHGIGLKSIKKLVEDKKGYFNISVKNNIFSLEILLYDEIES